MGQDAANSRAVSSRSEEQLQTQEQGQEGQREARAVPLSGVPGGFRGAAVGGGFSDTPRVWVWGQGWSCRRREGRLPLRLAHDHSLCPCFLLLALPERPSVVAPTPLSPPFYLTHCKPPPGPHNPPQSLLRRCWCRLLCRRLCEPLQTAQLGFRQSPQLCLHQLPSWDAQELGPQPRGRCFPVTVPCLRL